MGDRAAQRLAAVIVPETLLQEDFQVSAHVCPRAMVRELMHVFQGVPSLASAVAIPTVQHTVEDLVRMGEEVEDEKDRCLRNVRRSTRIEAGGRRDEPRGECSGSRGSAKTAVPNASHPPCRAARVVLRVRVRVRRAHWIAAVRSVGGLHRPLFRATDAHAGQCRVQRD